MSASDFEVGSRVRHYNDPDKKGVVLSNKMRDGDFILAVEWDDGSLEKVNSDDVVSFSAMDEEFEKAQALINEKLTQASELVRQAADLAKKVSKELHDTDDVNYAELFKVNQLERAMSYAGWRTSSWHC